MPAEQNAHEPGPAEFERIVSRLRAEDPQLTDARRLAPPITSPKVRTQTDIPFVLACLAIILPMSMVIGGWIGLAAMLTSTFVATRLIEHAAVT